MERRYRPLYASYGASELKRVYQRNYLIGNGVALGIVACIMLLYFLFVATTETVAIGGDREPPDTTGFKFVAEIGDGYTVVKERSVRPAQGEIPDVPAGFVPVSDSLLSDMPEEELPIDPGGLHDPFMPPSIDGPPGVGGGGTGIGGSGMIDEPRWDQFVPLEKQPEIIKEHKPIYPRLAKDAGIEGDVYLRSLLDIDGSVLKVEVAKSSESPLLDAAAVEAGFKCRFSPGVQNGRPVKVWITYKVSFVLGR